MTTMAEQIISCSWYSTNLPPHDHIHQEFPPLTTASVDLKKKRGSEYALRGLPQAQIHAPFLNFHVPFEDSTPELVDLFGERVRRPQGEIDVQTPKQTAGESSPSTYIPQIQITDLGRRACMGVCPSNITESN